VRAIIVRLEKSTLATPAIKMQIAVLAAIVSKANNQKKGGNALANAGAFFLFQTLAFFK
jgi:hypothetical protein